MATRLTTILNIDVPVMLAGMGGVSYSELAAAVSNAGAYGCLGASTMSSDELAHEIARTRELTDRPFGVDLLTAFPDSLDRNIDLIIEGGATALVAGLGIPTRVIDTCHRHGIMVMSMCGKVEHARRAVDAGCDVVIAQGTEAGGHTGTVATFPLIPLVVDAVGGSVPVVAAGGIADGRGLAAALALGADGVWVGTRFIATPEARALPGFSISVRTRRSSRRHSRVNPCASHAMRSRITSMLTEMTFSRSPRNSSNRSTRVASTSVAVPMRRALTPRARATPWGKSLAQFPPLSPRLR